MKSAQVVALHWGEVLAAATTIGLGHLRVPLRHPQGGDTVDTEIDGIGHVGNRVVPDGWV